MSEQDPLRAAEEASRDRIKEARGKRVKTLAGSAVRRLREEGGKPDKELRGLIEQGAKVYERLERTNGGKRILWEWGKRADEKGFKATDVLNPSLTR